MQAQFPSEQVFVAPFLHFIPAVKHSLRSSLPHLMCAIHTTHVDVAQLRACGLAMQPCLKLGCRTAKVLPLLAMLLSMLLLMFFALGRREKSGAWLEHQKAKGNFMFVSPHSDATVDMLGRFGT